MCLHYFFYFKKNGSQWASIVHSRSSTGRKELGITDLRKNGNKPFHISVFQPTEILFIRWTRLVSLPIRGLTTITARSGPVSEHRIILAGTDAALIWLQVAFSSGILFLIFGLQSLLSEAENWWWNSKREFAVFDFEHTLSILLPWLAKSVHGKTSYLTLPHLKSISLLLAISEAGWTVFFNHWCTWSYFRNIKWFMKGPSKEPKLMQGCFYCTSKSSSERTIDSFLDIGGWLILKNNFHH